MAGRIAWLAHPDNPATSSTLTTTTSAASYPASNMQNLPTVTRWRSTIVASAQDIEIDFGSARAVDLLALVNHNLTETATIAIAAGSTLSYADVSATMPWREFLAFKWLSSPETYRYWRIRITDTSNGDGYIAVGYLIVGSATLPAFTMRQGWITSPEFVNLEGSSSYGVPAVDDIHRRQILNLGFGPLTSSEISTLRSLYTTAKHDTNPLILLPERDGSDAYFGRIVSMFDERLESAQHYTGSFSLIEDSYGNRR